MRRREATHQLTADRHYTGLAAAADSRTRIGSDLHAGAAPTVEGRAVRVEEAEAVAPKAGRAVWMGLVVVPAGTAVEVSKVCTHHKRRRENRTYRSSR